MLFFPNATFLVMMLIPLIIWSLFWKILGLWFSAKNNEKIWFVIFIFINLIGILAIYYLYTRRCWPFKQK